MFPGAALILVTVALVLPAFFVLSWILSGYHRLVALRNAYVDAYARIDTRLRQRYEIVLSLVEAAKASLDADRGAPEAVLASRHCAMAARARVAQTPGEAVAMQELSGAEAALNATLARLLPLLDALSAPGASSADALKLREELLSLGKEIESARVAFNDAAMRYNAVRATFPNSLLATPLGFAPAEPFAIQKVADVKS